MRFIWVEIHFLWSRLLLNTSGFYFLLSLEWKKLPADRRCLSFGVWTLKLKNPPSQWVSSGGHTLAPPLNSRANRWLPASSPRPRTAVSLPCYPDAVSLCGWTRSWHLLAFLSERSTHPTLPWFGPLVQFSDPCKTVCIRRLLDSIGGNEGFKSQLHKLSSRMALPAGGPSWFSLRISGGGFFLSLDRTCCSHTVLRMSD